VGDITLAELQPEFGRLFGRLDADGRPMAE